METQALVSVVAGAGGVITGVVGTVFTLGRRYAEMMNKYTSLAATVEELQVEQQYQREIETKNLATMNAMARGLNAGMASITTALAVFNDSCVKQKDLMDIVQRLSRIEGLLNGEHR